jgi:DNA-binding response OmpR family regulator
MKGKHRVLIVDDNRSLVVAVERVLQKEGFDVLTAFDGHEGLEKARAEKPDLIILDIMMPNMDGYTACHEIKTGASTKNIPVVMLTALEYELNKELAKRLGANGYITKPIDSQVMMDAIKPFLGTS